MAITGLVLFGRWHLHCLSMGHVAGSSGFWPKDRGLPGAANADPNRNSFSRLCPVQIRDHSRFTFSRPRSRNCLKPRPYLICPNTGSTVCLRRP